MRTNNIGFCAVTPVSIGQCSVNQHEKRLDTGSIIEARKELEEASKKLTDLGIPHTPFTIVNTDRFNKTYNTLEEDFKNSLDERNARKTSELMNQMDSSLREPLVDIHHFVATGTEHEGFKNFDGLDHWTMNFHPNLKKEDPKSLVALHKMNGLMQSLQKTKEAFIAHIFEFAERIPLEQLLKKK